MSGKVLSQVQVEKELHSDTLMIRMFCGEDRDGFEVGDIEYVLSEVSRELRERLGQFNKVTNNELPSIGFDFYIELDLEAGANSHRTHNYSSQQKCVEQFCTNNHFFTFLKCTV